MKLEELPIKPPKILLYGSSGSGKTALATTCGPHCQVIDFDDGVETARTLADSFQPQRRQIDVLQALERDPAFPTAYAKGKEHLRGVATQCNQKKYPFKVLVIDSLTSMADACLRMVLKNSNKLETSGGMAMNPEIQHWGLAFLEMESFLSIARSLPIAVILIAHEQMNEIDGVNKLQLAISGKKNPTKIPRFFDELWYMKTRNAAGGKIEYVIQTNSTAGIEARSRKNIPDLTNANVGMPELLKRMGYPL